MTLTECFPRVFSLVFVPYGDRSILFVDTYGLPPIRLSSHSSDIQKGDGYRWYYAFSIAFLVHLGWSPIIRDLFGLKRRSNRNIEKGEDGARAQMIEEFVCLLLFRDTEHLSRPPTDDLIHEIMDATRLLEVSSAGTSRWAAAIGTGIELFTYLKSNLGGTIEVDLDNNRLVWRDLPAHMSEHAHSEQQPKAEGSAFIRSVGCYELIVVESKPNVVEVFAEVVGSGLVNLGSKAEEWSLNESDGFRWHDLYHLSNFAILGWSAVCKAMLRLDDNQSPSSGMMGMRAALLEEALIARFYTEISSNVDAETAAKRLGRLAHRLSFQTKIQEITPENWSMSFLTGYRLMSEAKTFGGGKLRVDVNESVISFVR